MLRIEYETQDGVLSFVECETPPSLHRKDSLSIQMELCALVGGMVHPLAEAMRCGGSPEKRCGKEG